MRLRKDYADQIDYVMSLTTPNTTITEIEEARTKFSNTGIGTRPLDKDIIGFLNEDDESSLSRAKRKAYENCKEEKVEIGAYDYL